MFKLDDRLKNDSHNMGMVNGIQLRLHKNAEVPWFILVPETNVIELCDLPEEQFQQLMKTANELSLFIKENFKANKINVAAIGNIVSQLHLHVIGRFKDDFAWPGVVWGADSSMKYQQHKLSEIKKHIVDKFGS